jgi:hypothetical protein
MAPVVFTLDDGRTVKPYYVSPWWDEPRDDIAPAVLIPLRGDFFCLPFGGANDRGDEHHEPHGESAYAEWTLKSLKESRIDCTIDYAAGGRVEKTLVCAEATPAIYTEHTISGFSGRYPFGHHATLTGAAPDEDGSRAIWKIFTAPFDFGMTDPGNVAPSAAGEYYSLAAGTEFSELQSVPTRWKDQPTTDCSLFPHRDGFVDIIAWYRVPSTSIAWTVAYNVRDKYAWYSLKDPRVLPGTVMWIENRGRHGAPWNGRNSCVGIEETCGYFANGLDAPEDGGAIGARGIPTTVDLRPDQTTTIRTIQGVFPIDDESEEIVAFDSESVGCSFRTKSGTRYGLGIDVSWLKSQC